MNAILSTIAKLRGEPVAITTAISAVFALVVAVRAGAVTEGVVTAAVIAVLGLFARSQVSPVSSLPPPPPAAPAATPEGKTP